jgi:hypothetical protein
MGHSVGRSSYGDLAGVEQFVSRQDVAAQVASLAFEFDSQLPGAHERGDRLTVNEGIRSRRRMELLRAAWEKYLRDGTPFAALAAALYFSTHREEIGTALDFGITQEDGTNRAMTPAEAAWVHEHGVRRGIVWTGRTFKPQESWHHNGGYPASIPPITGVNLPGARLYTSLTKVPGKEPAPRRRRNMDILWADDHKSALLVAGSDRTMVDDRSPKIDGLSGLEQARVWEKAVRIDPTQPWGGKGKELTKRELQNVAHIMGAIKEGYSA